MIATTPGRNIQHMLKRDVSQANYILTWLKWIGSASFVKKWLVKKAIRSLNRKFSRIYIITNGLLSIIPELTQEEALEILPIIEQMNSHVRAALAKVEDADFYGNIKTEELFNKTIKVVYALERNVRKIAFSQTSERKPYPHFKALGNTRPKAIAKAINA